MRSIYLVVLIFMLLCFVGCARIPVKQTDVSSIKTYKDIPGITEDEITEIENIKSERSSLSYMHLEEAESFILPDGTYMGYATRFCAFMSELFGIEFVPEIRPAHEFIGLLNNKEMDFTGDIAATDQRVEGYGWHMTKPIAVRPFKLFTNLDSEPIKDVTGINGLRVGFWGVSSTIGLIAECYPQLNYEVVECFTLEDAAELLETGEIDAYVMDNAASSFFEKYDFIRSQDFFTSVRKDVSVSTGNDELAAFISALDKYLDAGGYDKIAELYKTSSLEYAEYKLAQSYTPEESAYLKDLAEQNKTIKVAVEYDSYPASFYNATEKEYQGIALDILDEIGILTGIVFEPVAPVDNSLAALYERVRQGEIPMAAQMFYTQARKDDYIWSSVPYDKSYYAILSKTDYPYITSTQVFRTRIGAIDSSAYEEIYFENFINGQDVVHYPNQSSALDALESGEIDLLMASEYMLLAQTNYREKSGLKINMRFDMPMEPLFGFNKDEYLLRSIIDKAQTYVKTDYIALNWTRRVFDYSQKITEQRSMYFTIASGILFICLAAVTFFLQKNRRLYREKKKTEEALQQAHDIIVSNIEYSSKIQRNLLPQNDVFANIFTDFSVIWNPRDIVGGDIYWIKKFNKGALLCVCDCTGHGISGALLSMLVAAVFEGWINENNYTDTAEIIRLLDRGLSRVLNVDTDKKTKGDGSITNINEGCDLAVLFISNDGDVSISAGHTHVFVCDGRKVNRIRGQNIHVGEGKLKKSDIKVVTVPKNSNNKFYIATDGLFDQMGGEPRRPFGYSRFKKILIEHHDKTQEEISQAIWKEFEAYRGKHARIDDVELISFKQ